MYTVYLGATAYLGISLGHNMKVGEAENLHNNQLYMPGPMAERISTGYAYIGFNSG